MTAQPQTAQAKPAQNNSDQRFSEPAASNPALQKALKGRDDLLRSIPSMSTVVQEVLDEVSQPPENVNLMRLADLISRDESLAAQCLRVANSALFARGTPSDSVRGAVRTLGISRIHEIAVSSSMMRIGGAQKIMDPTVFWEHSLGCAIISRKLARAVGFDDPEKAYLAGLLHDLGYVVNMVLFPEREKIALDSATQSGSFLGASEHETLGFTHCQSGEVLARTWGFSDELIEVILCHHNPPAATLNPALVAMIALADRLCRSAALGVGYVETTDPALAWQSEWQILQDKSPYAAQMKWGDFVKDSQSYLSEVRELVQAMCGTTH